MSVGQRSTTRRDTPGIHAQADFASRERGVDNPIPNRENPQVTGQAPCE
jgi:hypothetical protein